MREGYGHGHETLGDDLVLLSIRSDGVIGTQAKLHLGLSGAELVRLAALRRVDIERRPIIILDENQAMWIARFRTGGVLTPVANRSSF